MSAGVIAAHYAASGGGGFASVCAALNPVLWYKADAASGTTLVDSGSKGMNLAGSGGITWGKPAIIPGYPAVGMGPGYFSAAAALPTTSSLTVIAFVRPAQIGTYQEVFLSDDSAGNSPRFNLRISNGNAVQFYVGLNTGAQPTGGTAAVGTAMMMGGSYVSGSYIKSYKNGVPTATGAVVTGSITPNQPVQVGALGGGTFPYKGDLSNLLYFAPAITDAQILDIYNASLVG